MSLLADSLQPFIFGSLTKVTGRASEDTISDLFTSSKKYGFELSFEDASFEANFMDSELIAQYFASDISRFASASFQTMRKLDELICSRDTMPWGIIMLYYSSFYSAHALLRIFGKSVSYFNKRQILPISKLADAMSAVPSFPLAAAAYHVEITRDGEAVVLKREQNSNGGAHETFWDMFGSEVERMGEKILRSDTPPTNAQEAYQRLEALRSCMRSSNAPRQSWLSSIRNEVQYKHGHGLWLPPKINKTGRKQLARIASQWQRDPVDVDIDRVIGNNSLDEFIISCVFIVSLMRIMLERIADRSPSRSESFVEVGPFRILRE